MDEFLVSWRSRRAALGFLADLGERAFERDIYTRPRGLPSRPDVSKVIDWVDLAINTMRAYALDAVYNADAVKELRSWGAVRPVYSSETDQASWSHSPAIRMISDALTILARSRSPDLARDVYGAMWNLSPFTRWRIPIEERDALHIKWREFDAFGGFVTDEQLHYAFIACWSVDPLAAYELATS